MIEVGEERARSFLSAVGLIGQREAEGHHAFGPESGIELLQAQQTLDEQRGARDHRQRDRDAESYYATLAHETTHWTAHESRLARDFGTTRFGSGGYAIEELVAELGAAFLCADLDSDA